jgi:hypothetical protein
MPALRRSLSSGLRARLRAKVAAGPKQHRHVMSQTACARHFLLPMRWRLAGGDLSGHEGWRDAGATRPQRACAREPGREQWALRWSRGGCQQAIVSLIGAALLCGRAARCRHSRAFRPAAVHSLLHRLISSAEIRISPRSLLALRHLDAMRRPRRVCHLDDALKADAAINASFAQRRLCCAGRGPSCASAARGKLV